MAIWLEKNISHQREQWPGVFHSSTISERAAWTIWVSQRRSQQWLWVLPEKAERDRSADRGP